MRGQWSVPTNSEAYIEFFLRWRSKNQICLDYRWGEDPNRKSAISQCYNLLWSKLLHFQIIFELLISIFDYCLDLRKAKKFDDIERINKLTSRAIGKRIVQNFIENHLSDLVYPLVIMVLIIWSNSPKGLHFPLWFSISDTRITGTEETSIHPTLHRSLKLLASMIAFTNLNQLYERPFPDPIWGLMCSISFSKHHRILDNNNNLFSPEKLIGILKLFRSFKYFNKNFVGTDFELSYLFCTTVSWNKKDVHLFDARCSL